MPLRPAMARGKAVHAPIDTLAYHFAQAAEADERHPEVPPERLSEPVPPVGPPVGPLRAPAPPESCGRAERPESPGAFPGLRLAPELECDPRLLSPLADDPDSPVLELDPVVPLVPVPPELP